MFFKKRREAKKAAAAELRQNILDALNTRIEEAEKNPNRPEGLLKLQDIANDIDAAVEEIAGIAQKSANTKRKLLFWSAMPAGVAVSALYPPALLGLLGMGASVYGGDKLSKKFGEQAAKSDIKAQQPFLGALQQVKQKAQATQDAIVIKHVEEIAASPLFVDVLAKAPRLREQFAAAYGRKMAEEKEQQQKAAPAAKKPFDPPNFGF